MAQPSVGDDAFQDFLLDMDFDELIPVDNFFNNYVGTLSEKQGTFGSRLPSVEVQDISQVYANGARGPSQQLHPSLAAQQQHMPQQPLPAPPNGSIPLWQEPVQAAVPPPNHHANGSQVPPAMHAHVPTATPPIQGAAPAHMSPPQPPQVNMADVAQNAPDSPGSQDNGSRSSGHRPSRRQTKTERQQMLNKAAQQRYRERKKAKAMELKQAVACLQDKVTELSVVQAEKVTLAERVDQLEKELALKEAQIVAMQKQGAPGGSRGDDGGEEPSQESLDDFVCQFKNEVKNLQEWLTRFGYAQRDMLRVEELPPADVDALRAVTERCYAACLRCLSMFADVDIVGLMDSTVDRSQMRFHGGPDMWNALVQRLQLQPATIEHALQLRGKYMARLDELFNERQSLNLQAIKVLLPQEMGGLSVNGKESGGRTFQERCKHAYETGAALRRLRANLAAEQKALAELDYLVYIKLLDPVQLSKCILAAFPEHCDVVSLLNAIHTEHAHRA